MLYQKIMDRLNGNEYQNVNQIVITSVTDGQAEGEVALRSQHFNPAGFIHGGLIFSLVDSLSMCAVLSRGNTATTSSVNIHYINQGHQSKNKKIKAAAKELKNGRRLSVVEVEVFDEDNIVISKATATIFRFDRKLELT